MGNTIKQCINITIKESLRALTEVTLKSLKENREIRQCAGIPYVLKDTLKDFDDFKNKQKRV